jgi:hypothetical protein
MRRALVAAVLVAVLATSARGASAADPSLVSVELDRTTVTARTGDRFVFHSTVRNTSHRALAGRVAHLNVVSLDRDTYVDPEDWSANRTQYIGSLRADGSKRLTWTVRAVNTGRFILYVTVVSQRGSDRVDASAALRATVAAQQALNAKGVLPIAIATPAVLVVLLVLTTRRRRRLA